MIASQSARLLETEINRYFSYKSYLSITYSLLITKSIYFKKYTNEMLQFSRKQEYHYRDVNKFIEYKIKKYTKKTTTTTTFKTISF